ncbi:MAG: HAD family hydrolase [Anaerolineae bacterium]|nr:HAD family hydrolase [Anaerolineae bacterium]
MPTHIVETWLVDFDETLAVGSLTWALQNAFPTFIQEHQLKYDQERLQQVMLSLQERSRQEPDTPTLLAALFEKMAWPQDLQNQFLTDLRSSYHPTLFEDTIPFLEQLRNHNRRVYIVSNNKRTPDHVNLLGINEYINGVFTPHACPDTQPKPHSSLWEFIKKQQKEIDPQKTAIIGDDPWADGAFADVCGLPCWIVDRQQRFLKMYPQRDYHWVTSLQDIVL